MNDNQIIEDLKYAITTIESDLEEWDPADSNHYLAYGPEMKEVVADLYNLLHHFTAHAKFEKDIAEAYNDKEGRTPYKFDDEWPDFVDGDIL